MPTLAKMYPSAKKGDYFRNGPWPARLMQSPRSGTPLMEVWGFEHECGSVYAKDLVPISEETAHQMIRDQGFDPSKQYYKG